MECFAHSVMLSGIYKDENEIAALLGEMFLLPDQGLFQEAGVTRGGMEIPT